MFDSLIIDLIIFFFMKYLPNLNTINLLKDTFAINLQESFLI